MMKTLIPLALILAPAALPLAAQAQQTDTSVRVSYADLDLSRAADRAVLDRRLDTALDQVCPTARPGYLTQAPEALRCQALTRQQIVAARQQALAQRGGTIRISANP
jgi:UrcA family protein